MRGNDSLETFEEVLKRAQEQEVSCMHEHFLHTVCRLRRNMSMI